MGFNPAPWIETLTKSSNIDKIYNNKKYIIINNNNKKVPTPPQRQDVLQAPSLGPVQAPRDLRPALRHARHVQHRLHAAVVQRRLCEASDIQNQTM